MRLGTEVRRWPGANAAPHLFMWLVVAVALLVAQEAEGVTLRGRAKANPIRKVVNLLKKLEVKVNAEGEKAEELFEKYMCYCKTTTQQLDSQIAAANQKIPLVEAELKQATASHKQLEEDLKTHKQDRADAKKAVATSTALREKAAATYASESTSMTENVKAMGKAIEAISKGMGNAFLQTNMATELQKLSLSIDMDANNREMLAAFLTAGGTTSDGYEPKSGEIVGILKQMKEDMGKDLVTMTDTEETDKQQYAALVSAKAKEIEAATRDVELKTGRVGELAVQIAELKDDLEDTTAALAEDQTFLANLKKSCENKKAKYTAYKDMMNQELVALADTIKILNDDDALELFKKTLPSSASASALQVQQQPQQATEDGEEESPDAVAAAPSFLQTKAKGKKNRRRQAAAHLKKGTQGDPRMSLLVMAMKGQKVGFDAIIAKVDELVGVLAQEQKDDDAKQVFCNNEIDKTEDELKANKRAIQDRQAVIAELEEGMATVTKEINDLVEGIKTLDAEVQEQTALRKAKNKDVVDTLAGNNAAKQLLELAKNRMNKFYNPKLAATALAQEEDGEEYQQIPAAPEADFDFSKKGEESGGVLHMLDMLREDLTKEIVALETQEKEAQADYEQFLTDSSNKRIIDSKAVSDKEGVKAEIEEKLNIEREGLRGDMTEAKQTQQELAGLHGDCDWLLQNHELRKTARAAEADSLQKAKAVLSGADYS